MKFFFSIAVLFVFGCSWGLVLESEDGISSRESYNIQFCELLEIASVPNIDQPGVQYVTSGFTVQDLVSQLAPCKRVLMSMEGLTDDVIDGLLSFPEIQNLFVSRFTFLAEFISKHQSYGESDRTLSATIVSLCNVTALTSMRERIDSLICFCVDNPALRDMSDASKLLVSIPSSFAWDLDNPEACIPLYLEKQVSQLKRLLFIVFLVQNNPCDSVEKSFIFKTLLNGSDCVGREDNRYSSVQYSSLSIFPLFSRNAVCVLSRMLSSGLKAEKEDNTLMMLRKIVQYLGLIRCVVDLFDLQKSTTPFGRLVKCIYEHWGDKSPERVFQRVLFSGMSLSEAQQYFPDRVIAHIDSDYSWDVFLSPFLNALSSSQWHRGISDFMYWFSVSSVFERGQSAVMEWMVKAFWQVKGITFNGERNDIVVKGAENVISLKILPPILPRIRKQNGDWISCDDLSYKDLFRLIEKQIEAQQLSDEELTKRLIVLFSHYDVIALCISDSNVENDDLVGRFYEFVSAFLPFDDFKVNI